MPLPSKPRIIPTHNKNKKEKIPIQLKNKKKEKWKNLHVKKKTSQPRNCQCPFLINQEFTSSTTTPHQITIRVWLNWKWAETKYTRESESSQEL